MFSNSPFQNRLMLLNAICHYFSQTPANSQDKKEA